MKGNASSSPFAFVYPSLIGKWLSFTAVSVFGLSTLMKCQRKTNNSYALDDFRIIHVIQNYKIHVILFSLTFLSRNKPVLARSTVKLVLSGHPREGQKGCLRLVAP